MPNPQALLVIDVQRIYMEPDPMVTSDGNDLIPKCRGLIARARAASVPVLFVRHVSENQPNDPDLVGIHPDLSPADGEPVIQKRFGSAFFKTDLESILSELDVETLYVCGLATFGCVNATVMCALCKDYDVRVIANGHGCVGSDDTSASSRIEIFNDIWGKAGATLIRAEDLDFNA
ncbi:isochorismatase family protein [Candidatus Bipolaricaulota bacterium]|nr:isochorismatase family protein [Candidatus Bipolaricaulota bacterium]